MTTPREAINALPTAAAVALRVSALLQGKTLPEARAEVLADLRQTLLAGRDSVRKRFEIGHDGVACAHDTAHLTDAILCGLTDATVAQIFATDTRPQGERLAVIAVGGYGRGEMAPFSDLDIMFLLGRIRSKRIEIIIEFILYILWDLGIKVGHSVRSYQEAIHHSQKDFIIRTSLLESRFLTGHRPLFQTFRQRFRRTVMNGTGPEFIEDKLAERDARHRRLGDTRYVLEPNVKDGKGGLRDLHTLFWIARYLHGIKDSEGLVGRGIIRPDEARLLRQAHSFLWSVRCHLHYLAGRAEERLTFDVQAEIGCRMNYKDKPGVRSVERFMRRYFLVARNVGDLTRTFCAALEAEQKRPWRLTLAIRKRLARSVGGFILNGDRLSISEEQRFDARPVDMIRLFHVAQQNALDIHPEALRAVYRSLRLIDGAVRNDVEANRLFLDILTGGYDPEITLRRMNEVGVLGRFVPEFGRIVALMQYGMYHAFTVDEHTIRALGILRRIDSGAMIETAPFVSEVMARIHSRRALYVALFFHDIAKGRGSDHQVLGARIVERAGPRLGLSLEEVETAAWLVRWHLALSQTAFHRDLEDEYTIQEIAALIQSPERLKLLFVLTTADIMAVGPGRWNAWNAALLETLYTRVENQMSGGLTDLHMVRERRQAQVAQAQAVVAELLANWPVEAIARFHALGYAPYWLSFDGVTHARHAQLIHDAVRDQRPLTVDIRTDRARAVTEVTIYTIDHPGLFAGLAGALAVSGASILDARVFTMTNGMALDVFSIQDRVTGGCVDSGDRRARLSVNIQRAVTGELCPVHELAQTTQRTPVRMRSLSVPARVLIDNQASRTYTVVEIHSRDRPGLLYDVARALTNMSIQIASAKISTYGVQAIDVFYLLDLFGQKVTGEQAINRLRTGLLQVLEVPLPAPIHA